MKILLARWQPISMPTIHLSNFAKQSTLILNDINQSDSDSIAITENSIQQFIVKICEK